MATIPGLRRTFRLPWRTRAQVAHDVDDELAFHLDMRAQELAGQGVPAEAARAQAWREFGDVEGARRALCAADARWERSTRRADRLDELRQDLRYAARQLRRSPGFTTVAALTLAVGIGATTAIFSAVDGVLLRPLPYADADRVVALWQSDVAEGVERADVSPGNFLDWRDRSRATDGVAAAVPFGFDLTGADGRPETLHAWLVTEGYFEVLGARPLLGRTFLPEEYAPQGQTAVVLLGYGLWQQRFGGDRNVVGRTLTLDRRPYVIVGVLPPDVRYPAERDLWAPTAFAEEDRRVRSGGYINVIARLQPGVTVREAAAELDAIATQLAREHPRTNEGVGVTVVPLREQVVSEVKPALLLLAGAVAFILAIACANVANLLLARGSRRRRELAVRGALGASRGRLVRQLLTESALLAALGCAGGLVLARWGIDVLLALAPVDVPAGQVGLDLRVLAFALAASAVTALLFGLAPALRFSRADVRGGLREGARGGSGDLAGRRLRAALVVGEIALAVVLLVGAGLLGRSLFSVLRVELGFRPENRLAMQVFVWDQYDQPPQRVAFFEEVSARLAALPGVRAAGAVSALPFLESRIDIESPFRIDGRGESTAGQEPRAYATVATPGYFPAIGMTLRRGRLFEARDDAEAPPVALINETLARRYFANEDPVGKRLVLSVTGRPSPREIVGVVADTRQTALEAEPRPELFVPHAQSGFGSMTIVVRTASDPRALVDAARREIWAVNKDLPIYATETLDGLLDASVAGRRSSVQLVGSLAVLALVLAALGIYGVVSFLTGERTHELAVRVALGARPRDILALTMRDGLALAVVGLATGGAVAAALTRLLRSQLYGVTATDPTTFAAAAVTLVAVALVASYLPARRAVRVEPTRALQAP